MNRPPLHARPSALPAVRLGWQLAFAAAGLFLMGCGDGRPRIVPVSGRVLMNGQPLTGHIGFVRVVPVVGRAATGRINPDNGRFSLTTYETNDGCVQGAHPAAVIVNAMVGNRLIWITPEHYGDDKTSGLTVEITRSTAELEIGLEGTLTPAPKASEADRLMQEAG